MKRSVQCAPPAVVVGSEGWRDAILRAEDLLLQTHADLHSSTRCCSHRAGTFTSRLPQLTAYSVNSSVDEEHNESDFEKKEELRFKFIGSMDAEPSVLSASPAARRYIYTSAAQRAYEDVDWDFKLPPRHKPPSTTLEKMADPVSQRFVLKRYHSRPELWQAIGSHWNKHQLRATFNARKPISFTSPCPKSGHIPLYCGTVGSENMDSVDVPGEDFIPLTVLRTTIPPHTPASYRTTIPGYTGKARFDRPRTSGVSLPSLPYTPQTAGVCPRFTALHRSAACVSDWRCVNRVVQHHLVEPNMMFMAELCSGHLIKQTG
ncbi:spermatogenesis-associated protein 48 isoform X1 [Carassius auratus]|uniref:Spermatogenesis-associated protein 48 isoform X1 n=1 Tax=Carassius auratus TaxID=7957 RepID=A0A6P6QNP7_CARAU|nr:spermatogenesis-associated protein 48-like isoform X1 [Carassius auratus]